MGLAVVRDLREVRAPAGAEEVEWFETDVVAGFVLARAAAGSGAFQDRLGCGWVGLVSEDW
ncbi:MAG: hypothetical protein ACRDTH_26935 [Pseudonocardiaceae bacterium]